MDSTSIQTLTQFYNDAFQHLMNYTVALITIVGIIVPLIIARSHTKTIMKEKNDLEKDLKREIADAIDKLNKETAERIRPEIEQFKAEFNSQLEKSIAEIQSRASEIEAKFWHLSAIDKQNENSNAVAAISFCEAIILSFDCEDENRARNCLKRLETCIDDISFEEEKTLIALLLNRIKGLIPILEKQNINGRYLPDLNSVKRHKNTIIAKMKEYAIEEEE